MFKGYLPRLSPLLRDGVLTRIFIAAVSLRDSALAPATLQVLTANGLRIA